MLTALTASGLVVGADWPAVPREPLFCGECGERVAFELTERGSRFLHCTPVPACSLFKPSSEGAREGLACRGGAAVDVFAEAPRKVSAKVLDRLTLAVLAHSARAFHEPNSLPARNLLASLRRASTLGELSRLVNLVLDLNPERGDLVGEPALIALGLRELVEALPWDAIHSGQAASATGEGAEPRIVELGWRPPRLSSPHFLVVDESMHCRNRGVLVETLEHLQGGELRVWTPDRSLRAEVVSSSHDEPRPLDLGKVEVVVPVAPGEALCLRLRDSVRALVTVLPGPSDSPPPKRPAKLARPKLFELEDAGRAIGIFDERRAFEWLCSHDASQLRARSVGAKKWLSAPACFPAHFAFD